MHRRKHKALYLKKSLECNTHDEDRLDVWDILGIDDKDTRLTILAKAKPHANAYVPSRVAAVG